MEINNDIKAAYAKWMKAEELVPDEPHEKKYKSRKATANKLYKVYSKLCEASGLNPITVSISLIGEISFTSTKF